MQSNWVTVLITNYQNTSAMKSQATTGNVTTLGPKQFPATG